MRRFLWVSVTIFFLLSFFSFSLPPLLKEGSENWVKDFVKLIRVEKPVSFKNLTIFPLTLEKVMGEGNILTQEEAIKSGYLRIYEKERAEVNTVLVENLSRSYIFLMSGELLSGCKQDRMVAYDTLIPPRSGRLSLRVFCTERGRWIYKSEAFKSLPFAANPRMRQVAIETESQEMVWSEISKKRAELKSAPSATDAFQDIVKDKGVGKEINDYVENIEKKVFFSENVAGVVVTNANHIICMDIFYHPRTFKKLWPKLLHGYVLDSIGKEENLQELTVKRTEKFISDILGANFSPGETDGEGEALKIESENVSGTSLIFKNFVIHLQVFPKASL